jgi:hypothetical protein
VDAAVGPTAPSALGLVALGSYGAIAGPMIATSTNTARIAAADLGLVGIERRNWPRRGTIAALSGWC